MRYVISVIFILLIASCQKHDYRYNPSRNVFLGNYHFTTIDYQRPIPYTSGPEYDTLRYDGFVRIPSVDNGNNIYVSHLDTTSGSIFSTTDSSFSTFSSGGGMGQSYTTGDYRNGRITITAVNHGTATGYEYLTIGSKY